MKGKVAVFVLLRQITIFIEVECCDAAEADMPVQVFINNMPVGGQRCNSRSKP